MLLVSRASPCGLCEPCSAVPAVPPPRPQRRVTAWVQAGQRLPSSLTEALLVEDDPFSETRLGKSGSPLIELCHIFFLLPGDRQENDKENLNLENCRDQEPPASGEPPSQASVGGLFGEDQLKHLAAEENPPEAQESPQGEWPGAQLSPQERSAGKRQSPRLPRAPPGEPSVQGVAERREGPQRAQPRAPMAQRVPTCRECGRTFYRNPQLIFHQRTHTTAKTSFQCPTCKKAFPRSSNLVKHQRTHTGEKPCKCDYCGKSFSDFSGLCYHKKTHTGEKPFKCPICEKSFIQRSNFNRHQRVHTGEKPYKCSLCGKSFSWRSSLDKHQRSHLGKKRFQ